MWDHVQEGAINVTWISTTLANGSFIGVKDGLYDQERAQTIGVVDGSYAASDKAAAKRLII